MPLDSTFNDVNCIPPAPPTTPSLPIETKAQMFRYRSLLLQQNENVLISSAYYRNKNRTFQSVPKLFKIDLERFGDFFKFKTKTEWNRVNLLSDQNVSIHLGFRENKTEL